MDEVYMCAYQVRVFQIQTRNVKLKRDTPSSRISVSQLLISVVLEQCCPPSPRWPSAAGTCKKNTKKSSKFALANFAHLFQRVDCEKKTYFWHFSHNRIFWCFSALPVGAGQVSLSCIHHSAPLCCDELYSSPDDLHSSPGQTPIFRSQTLNGPFSAVSKPSSAINAPLESAWRDRKFVKSSSKNWRIHRQFVMFGGELLFVGNLGAPAFRASSKRDILKNAITPCARHTLPSGYKLLKMTSISVVRVCSAIGGGHVSLLRIHTWSLALRRSLLSSHVNRRKKYVCLLRWNNTYPQTSNWKVEIETIPTLKRRSEEEEKGENFESINEI